MKKCILSAIVILLIISVIPAFASENYYEKGSTWFSVNAGVYIPFFAKFFNNSAYTTKTFPNDMHTKIGGIGTLSYQVFLKHKFALGGEIGYAFNYSNAKKIVTTVPICLKASFVPAQTGKFDLALHACLGGAYLKYNTAKFFEPYASFSINPIFFINDNWGLGINGGISMVLELHSNDLKKDNALAGFIPATLCITYRR